MSKFRLSLLSIIILLASCNSEVKLGAANSLGHKSEVICTEEAKLCPDGETYVARDPMNQCKFSSCP